MMKWEKRGIENISIALLIGIALIMMSGCSAGPRTMVVLLPESDGSVGTVRVSGQDQSSTVLESAYESANVGVSGTSVEEGGVLDQESVQQTFGEAMAVQPLPPEVFILYFKSGGAELTDASTAMIPDILESIRLRHSVDITVVGHTDRVGAAEENRVLSMERAEFVVSLLSQNGVNKSVIEASSHGEMNPIVPTEDDVAEPRNRRVEVMIR